MPSNRKYNWHALRRECEHTDKPLPDDVNADPLGVAQKYGKPILVEYFMAAQNNKWWGDLLYLAPDKRAIARFCFECGMVKKYSVDMENGQPLVNLWQSDDCRAVFHGLHINKRISVHDPERLSYGK